MTSIGGDRELPMRELADIVGTQRVLTDRASRELFSRDVYFWDDAPLADAIVQPGSPQEIVAVLKVARAHGFAVAPRGGGMSHTGGYVTARTANCGANLPSCFAVSVPRTRRSASTICSPATCSPTRARCCRTSSAHLIPMPA